VKFFAAIWTNSLAEFMLRLFHQLTLDWLPGTPVIADFCAVGIDGKKATG
jgi:hypothetical protein